MPESNHTDKLCTRIVHCTDALGWLKNQSCLADCSLVASLPDISEFPSLSLSEWQSWFIDTASLILSKTPKNGVSIFFQSDIKLNGHWIDKGYLCQKAAEQQSCNLLWHKAACRIAPGNISFGRTGYSHILCFSSDLTANVEKSSADIIPHVGEKTWERGMGVDVCLMIVRFIAEQTPSQTIVQPFCGQGGILAAANAFGLSAIGIERSPKRAEFARKLNLNINDKSWIKPNGKA